MIVSLKNVTFGWQLVIEEPQTDSHFAVGPVHESTAEAWAWQEENIRKIQGPERKEI